MSRNELIIKHLGYFFILATTLNFQSILVSLISAPILLVGNLLYYSLSKKYISHWFRNFSIELLCSLVSFLPYILFLIKAIRG